MELIVYHCGQAYRTDTDHIGKAIKCRLCGEPFLIGEQKLPPLQVSDESPLRKSIPLWNWAVMLYPICVYIWEWARTGSQYVGWLYGVSNFAYLLFFLAFYPGKFQLMGLKSRSELVIVGAIALVSSIVFWAILLRPH